ncbi:hypothetical protein K1719_005535 [Acacia pycnantha]|nr:hypothetical protein K1719_005535 [Acacia pycnantha]
MTTSMVMASSHKIFSLFFFITFLYFPTTQALTLIHINCSFDKTFAANSAFQSDRTTLLSSLASNNTNDTEFYNTSVSSGGDTVFGLFMCRGDVNLTTCHQCVVIATQQLPFECRASKEAIVWYDECLLRYSDRSFFSTVDTRPRFGVLNTVNVSNPANFMITLYDTMNKTADEAAKPALGKKKYATRSATFSAFQTVYCLAQCTPDLSPSDCRRCLSGTIGDLDWCCDGKQGGRVLYPSCNVRYESGPFYQSEATAPPPTPEILPPTNTTGSQVIFQPNSGEGQAKTPLVKYSLSLSLSKCAVVKGRPWSWLLLTKFSYSSSLLPSSIFLQPKHRLISITFALPTKPSLPIVLFDLTGQHFILSSLASNNAIDFNIATIVGSCDTVYGLFMCRGEINLTMCHQCVINASQRLPSECTASKEAIV